MIRRIKIEIKDKAQFEPYHIYEKIGIGFFSCWVLLEKTRTHVEAESYALGTGDRNIFEGTYKDGKRLSEDELPKNELPRHMS